jgi:hypothetical protein
MESAALSSESEPIHRHLGENDFGWTAFSSHESNSNVFNVCWIANLSTSP